MPGGTPASSQMRASSSAISGVISAGLTTTVLPAASAGAIFCASRRSESSGRDGGHHAHRVASFHGERVGAHGVRDGFFQRLSQAAAKNWKVPAVESTRARPLIGLPLSRRRHARVFTLRAPIMRYSTRARSCVPALRPSVVRKACCALHRPLCPLVLAARSTALTGPVGRVMLA